MDKMFLVEKGKFVVVRNNDKEVSFTSFEEFYNYYTEIDLTNKWYIDYEPERSLYIDTQENIHLYTPVLQYDTIINNIDTLIEKKNDQYYNKTLEQVKIIRKDYIKSKFREQIRLGCLTTLGFRFDCDDIDRANVIAAFLKMQITSASQITFIDYDNVSRDLTYEQMVTVGIEIGEYFQTQLYKKNDYYTDIDSKLTVEDVKLVDWI
jgi:hypothetical protein